MTRPSRRWTTPALLLSVAAGLALGFWGGVRHATPRLAPGTALPDVSALPPTVVGLSLQRGGDEATLELWCDLDPTQPVRVRVGGQEATITRGAGALELSPFLF